MMRKKLRLLAAGICISLLLPGRAMAAPEDVAKVNEIISSLPEREDLKEDDAETVEMAMELYTSLTTAEKIGVEDYEKLGMVGEDHNKLMCYLAATTRLMEKPLNILVLSSSGAGKSTLQDKTLKLMPPGRNLQVLRDDYNHMQNMIFGDKPNFDVILQGIEQLEKEINALYSRMM